MVRKTAMNRANVNLLLVDGESHIRMGLQNALSAEGYGEILTGSHTKAVQDALSASTPDAIIIDGDLPDGDALTLTKDIRNGAIGRNPFLPIIMTTWNPTTTRVQGIINHGVDFILVKPLAPAALFARLNGAAFNRRLFLMTADYLGPTRRHKSQRDDSGCIEVPNTLKDKLQGKPVNLERLSELVEMTRQKMNVDCVEKAALILTRTVAQVCAAYESGERPNDLQEPVQQILKFTDVVRRQGPQQMEQLCGLLADIVTKIRMAPNEVDARQIELLWPLAQSIVRGAKVDVDTDLIMSEILNVLSYCRSSSEFFQYFRAQNECETARAA